MYYARLVKNPAGKFALFQGNIKSASEWEAPGSELPPVKEEAKAVKEVRPPAHHCRSLLTQAHCSLPTDACSASCSSHHAQLTVHAVLSCVPFFLSLLPPTACRKKKKQQGGRREKEEVKAEAKEEVKKEAPRTEQGRRQEGSGSSHCCAPAPGWGWQPNGHREVHGHHHRGRCRQGSANAPNAVDSEYVVFCM